jgi:hypothetical protein
LSKICYAFNCVSLLNLIGGWMNLLYHALLDNGLWLTLFLI